MSSARTASDRPAPRTGKGNPALDAVPQLGLRERKKIKTRQTIRAEAYRLFEEQGYDATTVDQIAAAAEVSPSTFFRYFPSKEDLVLTDEYDPVWEAALLARPADEPLFVSLRQATLDSVREVLAYDPDEVWHRMRLMRDVPAVRTRLSESVSATATLLGDVLARRTGRPSDDFELRVLAGAVVGAFQQTVLYWSDSGDAEDFVALIERTLDVLDRDLGST